MGRHGWTDDVPRDLEEEKTIVNFWRIGAGENPEAVRAGRHFYLGKAVRSPVTGTVQLKDVQASKNFIFVDLWTRRSFTRNIKQLVADPHLFKAKPLPLRTWYWHSQYRACSQWNNIASTPGLGLWDSLSMRLNEVTLDWSPVMILAPMQMLVLCTNDLVALYLGLVVILVSLGFSVYTNDYHWLWASRHLSFPVRLVFFIVLIWRCSVSSGGTWALIGYICMIFACFVDFWRGDLGQLRGRRLGTHYEIVQELKNEVMICRWHGPSFRNDAYFIPEHICGIPVHQQRRRDSHVGSKVVIVAVVQGILCELIPLEDDDDEWFEAEFVKSKARNGEWALPFCGLDVFCPATPDVYAHMKLKTNSFSPTEAAWGTKPESTALPKTLGLKRSSTNLLEDSDTLRDLAGLKKKNGENDVVVMDC